MFSAICVIVAHGAGEVGYSSGPLGVIISVYETGALPSKNSAPIWAVLIGAFGIVIGNATYGVPRCSLLYRPGALCLLVCTKIKIAKVADCWHWDLAGTLRKAKASSCRVLVLAPLLIICPLPSCLRAAPQAPLRYAPPAPAYPRFGQVAETSRAVVLLNTAGANVIRSMGTKMSKITPSRGFCAELMSAMISMIGTQYGLPMSGSMIIVGCIVGVGLVENPKKGVNWRVFAEQIFAWISTLFFMGIVCAAIFSWVRAAALDTSFVNVVGPVGNLPAPLCCLAVWFIALRFCTLLPLPSGTVLCALCRTPRLPQPIM